MSSEPLYSDLFARLRAGAIWTAAFGGLNKAVTAIGQLLTAWFLVPADYGLAALAASVANAGQMFTMSGVRDLLVQRQAEYADLAGQALVVSIVINTAVAVLLLLAAPALAWIYGESGLVGLIALTVAVWPLTAIKAPYAARLYIHLRLKLIANLNFIEGVVFTATVVVLAALGFGAYSLVLPIVVKTLISIAMLRRFVPGVRPVWPGPEAWKSLAFPGVALSIASFSLAVQQYGVSYAAGFRGQTELAGYYFFGYQLAAQAIFLVAINLREVMFSGFARFRNDPAATAALMRKATGQLSLIVVPVCVAQYFLAAPLMHLLYDDKWNDAIPVIQTVSVLLVLAPVEVVATAVLMSRARFTLIAAIRILSALIIVGIALMTVESGDAGHVARSVAPVMAVTSIVCLWAAVLSIRRETTAGNANRAG